MSKKTSRILISLLAVLCLAAFSTVVYAGVGDEPTPTPTATPRPSPNPFTPDGTGTVLDNATDEDGKEFFTIITPDENVFYLIIDRQRSSKNVYFLNAVTEKDLLSLAEAAQDSESITPTPQPKPETTPQPTPQPEPEQVQPVAKKRQRGIGGLLVVLVILLIGGGAAYYFKQKSRQSVKGGTDLDEYDFDTEEDEDMALEDEDLYLDDDATETKDGEQ